MSRSSLTAARFKTLSDSTRLRLLNLLAGGEVCVCDLTATLGVVQPKVSRHLARLKRDGLVKARRDGKWTHYRLAAPDDPLMRHILADLRNSMRIDRHMAHERNRLRKVCCRNDKTRGRNKR